MLKYNYIIRGDIIKTNLIYYKSIYYVVLFVVFMTFSYIFFLNGINNEDKIKVYYQNGSLVDYKLNYDESSLLDNIDINYVYKSIFSEKVNALYKYSVEVYLHAYQDDVKNVIWFRKYDLIKDKEFVSNGNKNIMIEDNLNLDYKNYKAELDNFLSMNEIDGLGYLNIKIIFNEYLDMKTKDQDNTSKVISIDVMMEDGSVFVNNLLEKDSYYNFDKHSIMNFTFIILSMLCFSFAAAFFFLIIRMFEIIKKKQTRYSKEIKRILSKYDYAIVRVNRLYVSKKYNMIYLDNFDDLLDIYNTRNLMINYKETKRGMESIFVIIDKDDAWIYKFTSDDLK